MRQQFRSGMAQRGLGFHDDRHGSHSAMFPCGIRVDGVVRTRLAAILLALTLLVGLSADTLSHAQLFRSLDHIPDSTISEPDPGVDYSASGLDEAYRRQPVSTAQEKLRARSSPIRLIVSST
jgi:hypothetical protein